MNAPLLQLCGISKNYGSLVANDNIDLSIKSGEIHALLGENGAGKSTLIKILCGVQAADAGTILWRGTRIKISSPAVARSLGIGVVFQHFSLFKAMTVAENIALGLPATEVSANLVARINDMSAHYGLSLEANRPLFTLSVGEWQRVELVRCLLAEPQLLVLDEPTSVLTPQEAELLFKILRQLAADEGRAVLYISHRLREIRTLCNSTTVLRDGRVIDTCDPQQCTPAELAEKMIGSKPMQLRPHRNEQTPASGISLCLDKLNLPANGPFAVALDNISLEVPAGTIVGVAGIAGNGQNELGQVLSGELEVAPATVKLGAQAIGALSVQERRDLGLMFVPEQRLGHAAVAEFTLWENSVLTARHSQGIAPFGIMQPAAAKKFTTTVIDQFRVKVPRHDAWAAQLSGGNLQKFIVGREILQNPAVLVLMQPTWGVDAGAASSIRQALLDLVSQGTAVLVISQDLDELFEIADQIAVISDGRLSPLRPTPELSPAEIGLLMSKPDRHGL